MIKKIVIGLIVLGVLIFGGIFLFEKFFGKNIDQGISKRSEEFIKSQKALNNSKLGALLEKDKTSLKGTKVSVGTCFTFVMPFKVGFERSTGICDTYFNIESPRGNIVAYLRDGKVGTFEQMEGISFRRQSKDYTESQKVIKGRTYLMFKNTTEGYQKTAFSFDSDSYAVITLTASTLENLDSEFDTILNSLTFN